MNKQANEQEMIDFTNYLLEKSNDYLAIHPMNLIDALMASHNFHKKMIWNIAKEYARIGNDPIKVYRMADMTFRKAMKNLWREFLSPDKVEESYQSQSQSPSAENMEAY